jgi:3-methyladenine DNA glycosylase/8-oxoguanine DNA glycosylase
MASPPPVPGSLEISLRGPAGEPVDLWRTLVSHGVADLPPGRVDEQAGIYETTLSVPASRPRTVRIGPGSPGTARVDVLAGGADERLVPILRRILNLDEELAPFYAAASADPDLAWATGGAGRILRSPTVFEDVVKTICTTNCAWSATVRMTTALVGHLGEESEAGLGRAFPSPQAMAAAGEDFYREVVRAGYRGAYLRSLATSVAEESIELEQLLDPELSDDDVERRLLALPGVGPYAAAHVMMLIGRHSRLILDSWTRPKYARLTGKTKVADRTIERRFRRYGRYAGLAFWLYLTRDWVADEPSHSGSPSMPTPSATRLM